MMKQLLTGSALAVLLAATPALAQSDTTTQKQPEAQQTQPADTGAAADSKNGSMDAAKGDDMNKDKATTAQSSDTMSTDKSAQSTDTMSTDKSAQSGDAMSGDKAAQSTDTMSTDSKAAQSTDTMSNDNATAQSTDTMSTDQKTAQTGTDAAGMGSGEMYVGQQDEGELLASDLMGTSVQNADGDKLGDINDVVVADQGGIKAVVIGVGGFLGIGEKNVAVNYDQVEQTRDENGDLKLVLNTTKDDLENAPKFVSLEDQKDAQQAQNQQNNATGSGSMSGTTSNSMGTGATGTGTGATGTGSGNMGTGTTGQSQ